MSGTYDLYEGKKKVSDTAADNFAIQCDYEMFKKNVLLRLEKLEDK